MADDAVIKQNGLEEDEKTLEAFEEKRNLKKCEKTAKEVIHIKKIDFGKYEIDTTYADPHPDESNKESYIFGHLYVCEFCLKYMDNSDDLNIHLTECKWKQPRGKEIYNKGKLSVFQIDGKNEKEKEPEGNHNISCLLVLPHHQRQGLGRFLIHLSYMFSKSEKISGTPEKPLSTLGLLSYQNYWKSIVVEYLYKHVKEKAITIKSISDQTGIDPYDIGTTLQMLNLVKHRNGKASIVIKPRVLAIRMRILKAKKHIHLDEKCLHWSPSSQGNTSSNTQCNNRLTTNEILVKRKEVYSADPESNDINPRDSKQFKHEPLE